jgi:hypothetical protein
LSSATSRTGQTGSSNAHPSRSATAPSWAAVEVIAPRGEPVTVDAFKRVPIGTLLRLASDPSAAVRAHVAGLVPDPESLKRRPYSAEHLCAVVDVYRYAVSQDAPRATLAELFDVADKTVDLLGSWAAERGANEIGWKEPPS